MEANQQQAFCVPNSPMEARQKHVYIQPTARPFCVRIQPVDPDTMHVVYDYVNMTLKVGLFFLFSLHSRLAILTLLTPTGQE